MWEELGLLAPVILKAAYTQRIRHFLWPKGCQTVLLKISKNHICRSTICKPKFITFHRGFKISFQRTFINHGQLGGFFFSPLEQFVICFGNRIDTNESGHDVTWKDERVFYLFIFGCGITVGIRWVGGGGLVAESCLMLCDPMDCIPPGSSVHGILQTRILEWVAMLFSRVSFWPP